MKWVSEVIEEQRRRMEEPPRRVGPLYVIEGGKIIHDLSVNPPAGWLDCIAKFLGFDKPLSANSRGQMVLVRKHPAKPSED